MRLVAPRALRSGRLTGPRGRRAGFALLEVLAFAAILALAVMVLQRTLLAAEVSLMQARVEASVGRALRYHANLLLNCPFDLLPADGSQQVDAGHAYRPFAAASGSYEERLPFTIWVDRATTDAGTAEERCELRLRAIYQVPADAGAASNELPPLRQRDHPVIIRRPGSGL